MLIQSQQWKCSQSVLHTGIAEVVTVVIIVACLVHCYIPLLLTSCLKRCYRPKLAQKPTTDIQAHIVNMQHSGSLVLVPCRCICNVGVAQG